ncbi:hypothetical protein HDU96_000207, partial [Phlyctochytrium bullatum]
MHTSTTILALAVAAVAVSTVSASEWDHIIALSRASNDFPDAGVEAVNSLDVNNDIFERTSEPEPKPEPEPEPPKP